MTHFQSRIVIDWDKKYDAKRYWYSCYPNLLSLRLQTCCWNSFPTLAATSSYPESAHLNSQKRFHRKINNFVTQKLRDSQSTREANLMRFNHSMQNCYLNCACSQSDCILCLLSLCQRPPRKSPFKMNIIWLLRIEINDKFLRHEVWLMDMCDEAGFGDYISAFGCKSFIV